VSLELQSVNAAQAQPILLVPSLWSLSWNVSTT